jgi:hypothetical protein
METTSLDLFKKTVIFNENDCIFIQPLCDFFEINRENQQRIIKNDAILSNHSTKKSNEFLFGDNYPRTCLTKKGFIRWIQILNVTIVREDLKDKLIEYQTMIFDYLYGEAVIPSIKKEAELLSRNREIAKQVNQLMKEHKTNELEVINIRNNNYKQLGINFQIELPNENLKPFHNKAITNL